MVLIAFAAVYILWGSTYFFIRIGVETIPPFVLAGIRHIAIGLVFYPLFRHLSKEKPTPAQWGTTIITGLLLLLCGNGALSWAETRVPSGIASLLVATVSLWMVIIDWLRPGGVRPGPRVLIGFVLGFAGIALLVGPSHLGGSERVNPIGAAPVSSRTGHPALMARVAISFFLRFRARLFGLYLHPQAQHRVARSHLRLRKSCRGLVPRLVSRRRAVNAANPYR
jgi:drug/metabolite transporter (DMT)-like permease